MRASHCFIIILFLMLFLLPTCVSAETINPTDDEGLNDALKRGGTIYLNPGVYEIDGPLRIGSNTVLTGSKDAIIRVSPSSSQWFTGATGIINPSEYPLKNVEIYGFQIDGNLDELPRSYANYGTGDHNAERLIYLQGNKKTFMENISVHDMALYDSYSDGIQIAYANNVRCYNNFVSNCQHSGIFLVSVVGANVFKNDIAGITSDCMRLDNCMNTKIFDNVLYSYTGDNTNGQGTKGENGLQIADEGYSHGGGSSKPTHTTNIEVYGNTFANTGWHGIWLDSTKKGVTNVYIHDNIFLDGSEFETDGKSVEGISYDNPPSKDMSEQIFTSIYDFLNVKISESGYIPQGPIRTINPDWNKKGKYTEAYIYLAGYEGQITINNKTYIPDKPSKCAIVLTDTRNLAHKPAGQTSSVKLEDLNDGSLKVTLKVKTKYKVKDYKTKTILGKSVKVPYYKEKKETVTFIKTFTAPEVFPVLSADDINVSITYQNNSYNPHAIITVTPKNDVAGVITGVSYKYNGSSATEYRQIGYVDEKETGYKSADFKETYTWKFSDETMSYSYQALYIKGVFDPDKFKVIVKTPFSEIPVDEYHYTEVGDPTKTKINPAPFVIIIVLFIILRPLLQELSYNFGKR